MVKCDFPRCSSEGSVVSRLSPKGFLVATGNKPTHSERLTRDLLIVINAMMN